MCDESVSLLFLGPFFKKPPICPLYRRTAPVFLCLPFPASTDAKPPCTSLPVAIAEPLVLARPRDLPAEQKAARGLRQLGTVVILATQVGLCRQPAAISLRQQLEQLDRLFVTQVGKQDPPRAAPPPETVVHGEHPAMGRGVTACLGKQPATLMIGHLDVTLTTT